MNVTGFTISQGDLLPYLESVLSNLDGTVVDLSLSTVVFRMIDRRTLLPIVNDQLAVVTNAQQGKVRYVWQAGDTVTPGIYLGWFIVTTGGKTERFPNDNSFIVVVEESH